MPYLTIVCVCPPQTSMIVHGLVATVASACRSLPAAAGSRYSSRYFMVISRFELAELVHSVEKREDLFRFDFVNP